MVSFMSRLRKLPIERKPTIYHATMYVRTRCSFHAIFFRNKADAGKFLIKDRKRINHAQHKYIYQYHFSRRSASLNT